MGHTRLHTYVRAHWIAPVAACVQAPRNSLLEEEVLGVVDVLVVAVLHPDVERLGRPVELILRVSIM